MHRKSIAQHTAMQTDTYIYVYMYVCAHSKTHIHAIGVLHCQQSSGSALKL